MTQHSPKLGLVVVRGTPRDLGELDGGFTVAAGGLQRDRQQPGGLLALRVIRETLDQVQQRVRQAAVVLLLFAFPGDLHPKLVGKRRALGGQIVAAVLAGQLVECLSRRPEVVEPVLALAEFEEHLPAALVFVRGARAGILLKLRREAASRSRRRAS